MTRQFAQPVDFATAASLLKAGEVCAFPTETVYGLGADATSTDAVLKIFETKKRPRFNPLIVHCADMDMAKSLAEFSPTAQKLARLWPGPLTLVLPLLADAQINDLVTAGLQTIGIRIPVHPLARSLVAKVGKPLAAPSANPSGRISPTTAAQVMSLFEHRVPVLDGGPCETGLESTILAVDGDIVMQLRAGGLDRGSIETHLGSAVPVAQPGDAAIAPGMLKSHYAPVASLRLNADFPKENEAYLSFGPDRAGHEPQLNLSKTADLAQAARNLFAHLHKLDATGVATIAVAPIPDHGLGEAINDRLQRAAAPRPDDQSRTE